ncbi:hypothetical protein G8C92_25275 [Paenibacillus donghaensis]|uniref:hypothetical protein n=1 Tax=Paenibacillus donghaensis TaxID=414771 RepID=UPI00188485E8|nr:hypothetical protein [Paenibacillus donghaensis]MBE9917333.1 hypothetical protein [Paenibacillus donghaensis]
MTNNQIFNNPINNPIGAVPPEYSAAQSGVYYTITTGAQTVSSANGYMALELTNPANSGKTIRFELIRATSSVSSIISLYRNATLNVSGTSATPRNTNWGFTDSSKVTGTWVAQTGDPISGGVLLQTIEQLGGPTEIDFNGKWLIPSKASNQTLIVLLQNKQANSEMSINVSWWEL